MATRSFRTTTATRVFALLSAACLAASGVVPSAASAKSSLVISTEKFPVNQSRIVAKATLIVHRMPAATGGTTPATTLLFVPKTKAPRGGWPVIVWAHGTTSVSASNCAPSQTPATLDGGLGAVGLPIPYPAFINGLVAAGYAVVAPDYEGLGAKAKGPHRYYDIASGEQSMIAALRAARSVDRTLGSRWVAIGHSQGGQIALTAEEASGRAPELQYLGAIAFAPGVNWALGDELATKAEATITDPAQLAMASLGHHIGVAAMTIAAQTQDPSFDAPAVMGGDLLRLLPALRTLCMGQLAFSISAAVTGAPGGKFDGARPSWTTVPAMAAFLARSDLGVKPGVSYRLPVLIIQGAADQIVPTIDVETFARKMIAAGYPVEFVSIVGADHGDVLVKGAPEMLAFLRQRFP